MKKLLFTILLLFTCVFAFGQALEISLQGGIKEVSSDLDARVYSPVKDQNDRSCALIKVSVTNTLKNPLTLDVGGLGVTKREKRENGEIWFYVPYQVKNLSFRCQDYNDIPIIPVQLKEATVYTLKFQTSVLAQTVYQVQMSSNYLKIIINEPGATVSIGKTTNYEKLTRTLSETLFRERLDYGEYFYKVSHPLYADYTGSVVVGESMKDVVVNMKPSYSYLSVSSNPSGATLFVNGERKGVTPCKVDERYPKGSVNISLQMNDYYALSQSVSVVGDGGTQMVNLTLKPQFATVTLTCKDPKAEIWVDDEKKGVGSWTGRVSTLSQQHLVTVKREGYQSQEVALNVSDGAMVTQEIVAPIPLYGMLNVESTPDLAIVKVDGKNVGTTPLLTKLLAGKHKIEIVKEGYKPHSQDIVIEHNKELSLNKPLVKQAAAKVAGASDYVIEMVYVQGGTFQMGSNYGESDEKPVHSVTLDDFYIGKYEVTQAQWRAVMGSNPSRFKGDSLPVEMVSWNEVQEFIKRLNAKTGKTYRLPTEAEWEYAARGGNRSKGYKYSGSNKIKDVAWYIGNSGYKTHPVGTRKPNELGVYDMSGNVCEWCQDGYRYDTYSSSPQKNPQGPSSGPFWVLRGGSWYDYFFRCRSANRIYYGPDHRDIYCGFRLVLCP